MTGNNRVRFCSECHLNVYNFAELTRPEAEDLLRSTEGRICGRLYRRADGTVITKDCPVGLRTARQRVARVATAAFAALVSLCSAAVGQKQSDKDNSCKQQVKITTKVGNVAPDSATLSGTVFDPNSAVVARADIQITNRQTKVTASLRSNDEGRFSLSGLAPGIYEVVIGSPGFKELKMRKLKVAAGETVVVEATLLVGTETMGILVVEEPIQTPGTTILKGDTIRKLPKP